MFSPILILSMLAAAFMGGANAVLSNATNATLPMDVPDPTKIDCHIPGYLYSGVNAINEGIDHLNSLKGNATLGHQDGGGWCWRYSCSYRAGIYGCNDAQKDVEVPWSTLASYASKIKGQCTFDGSTGKVIQGQAFSPDGWNVVVGLKAGTTC
ncbi:hypothetical protein VP1G_06272 [Cytospora mali]|uniref:Ecp2 effector protein domain-containing protein n=1 Tax=Cytospora mali TaxID=578113 RepID=A0A194V4V7_CYTMA|nr:hypothetical protein VP1G_06272 [Valsa mali var. pyri (nom. inval.)]